MEQLLLSSPTMRTKIPFILLLGSLMFSAISINGQELRDAFRKVNQSVVIVRTKRVDVVSSTEAGMAIVDGLGSGVLVSTDGKILTAAHVVETADIARVEFPDGQVIMARVIGSTCARMSHYCNSNECPTESHRRHSATPINLRWAIRFLLLEHRSASVKH